MKYLGTKRETVARYRIGTAATLKISFSSVHFRCPIMSLAKNSACKYRVAHSDVYGRFCRESLFIFFGANFSGFRYLVAAKNIEAGEIILRETPLVVGPLTLDNLDLCFACMRTIFGKPSCLCTNCDVAYMCSRTCQVRRLGWKTQTR